MSRLMLAVVLGLSLAVGSLLAIEAEGTIKKIDAEKGALVLNVGGRERSVQAARDVKVLGADGKPLAGGLKAPELKEGTAVSVTVERGDGGPVLKELRLGAKGPIRTPKLPKGGKESVGFKPLTEMSATDRYKGEDGGLYGGGQNEPPPAHLAAARKATAQVVPLDSAGKPADDGKIGLVSISMSNATQEFSLFKSLADGNPAKSRRAVIVDCAQGGQAMAQWVDPQGKAWTTADRRLESANVSPQQVQVVWIKLANVAPSGDLQDHGRKLYRDTLAVLHNARNRFPNLRIAYLSSRIYGGYAASQLNPEPYAYEGAFVVRWLILDQIKGDAALNYDPARGEVKAPLLLWGPYFWADGTTPRKSDGLVYVREDLGGDGVHPSLQGRRKVADQILKFFKTDELAKTWFLKP